MSYVAMDSRKGKDGRKLCYSLTDFYKEYRQECIRQYGNQYKNHMISKSLFMGILKTYLKELVRWVIEDVKAYKMPRRLGKLVVVKRKCPDTSLQKQRLTFCQTDDEQTKRKLTYYAQKLFRDHYFVIKWKKINVRNSMKFIAWYKFSATPKAKKILSNHIYALSKDPYSPEYNAPDDESYNARNPLNLPAP